MEADITKLTTQLASFPEGTVEFEELTTKIAAKQTRLDESEGSQRDLARKITKGAS
jgi:hypothetical protein